jgi:serine/threonine protein kinase
VHSEEDYSDDADEGIDGYRPGGYHPVHIGEIYNHRYLVVQKLGWGHFSTVWMCLDRQAPPNGPKFVAMKVQKSASHYREAAFDEIELLKCITEASRSESYLLERRMSADHRFVVILLDHFEHTGPNGKHVCMVFEMLGENLLSLIKKYDYKGIPISIVRRFILQVCKGLDFLHRHSQIIHTDLKPENILIAAGPPPPSDEYIQALLHIGPASRKSEGGKKEGEKSKKASKKKQQKAKNKDKDGAAATASSTAGTATAAAVSGSVERANRKKMNKKQRKKRQKARRGGAGDPVGELSEAEKLREMMMMEKASEPLDPSLAHRLVRGDSNEIRDFMPDAKNLCLSDSELDEDAGDDMRGASIDAVKRSSGANFKMQSDDELDGERDDDSGSEADGILDSRRAESKRSGDRDAKDLRASSKFDRSLSKSSKGDADDRAASDASKAVEGLEVTKVTTAVRVNGETVLAPTGHCASPDGAAEDSETCRDLLVASVAVPWLRTSLFAALNFSDPELDMPASTYTDISKDMVLHKLQFDDEKKFLDSPMSAKIAILISSKKLMEAFGDPKDVTVTDHFFEWNLALVPDSEVDVCAAIKSGNISPSIESDIDSSFKFSIMGFGRDTENISSFVGLCAFRIMSDQSEKLKQIPPLEELMTEDMPLFWYVRHHAAHTEAILHFLESRVDGLRFLVSSIDGVTPYGNLDDVLLDEDDVDLHELSSSFYRHPMNANAAECGRAGATGTLVGVDLVALRNYSLLLFGDDTPLDMAVPSNVLDFVRPLSLRLGLCMGEDSVPFIRTFYAMILNDGSLTGKITSHGTSSRKATPDFKHLDALYQYSDVKIVDLGNACWTYKHFTDDIQTRQYRSPEVILGSKYDTSADIWSLACIVFELLTGDLLFDPQAGKNWERDEDHLAMIAELMGDFPKKVSQNGKRSGEFFTKRGDLKHIQNLKYWPLARVLQEKYLLSEEDASGVASFIEPMLAVGHYFIYICMYAYPPQLM